MHEENRHGVFFISEGGSKKVGSMQKSLLVSSRLGHLSLRSNFQSNFRFERDCCWIIWREIIFPSVREADTLVSIDVFREFVKMKYR